MACVRNRGHTASCAYVRMVTHKKRRAAFWKAFLRPLITNVSPHTILKHPPPKTKQKGQTSTAKKQACMDDKKLKEHTKRAHKRATLLYAEEKPKKNGLSTPDVM